MKRRTIEEEKNAKLHEKGTKSSWEKKARQGQLFPTNIFNYFKFQY